MSGVKGKSGRKVSVPPPWGPLYKSIGSQEKLAFKLGVSKATVGKWCKGTHRIPELARKEILRLCKYYRINEGLEQIQGLGQ
ncbi:MAG: helix-turn-helix transcriptional regulator [Deltaproteobacteria bacterium]|nr:helix-turn-helix transcriptional regulator [Deltaproteobacteria bacterium]